MIRHIALPVTAMRTGAPVLLPLLATLWLYAGSTGSPRADLTYLNPSGIHTLDPARMSWTQDLRIALNLWEGLTTYDPATLEPVAGAARFPPEISDDRLTYTFTIRRDARWSSADPVVAEDFVRGWRRAMEPGTAGDYAFFFTDYIHGAARYVAWRNQTVDVLTALSRLARGIAIDPADAPRLEALAPFSEIAADAGIVPPMDGRGATVPTGGDARPTSDARATAPTGSDTRATSWSRASLRGVPRRDATPSPAVDTRATDWHAWATRVSALPVDWAALHEHTHRRHAEEMDDRFSLVGVSAPNSVTLVVRLARPCPYFLDLTAFAVMSPIHPRVELLRAHHNGLPITAEGLVAYDPQWTKPEPRGAYPGLATNGPYQLAEWRFKRAARMEVNPQYRDAPRIACRSVEMVVYEDVGAAIMAYEAGDLDFLPAMDVPYDHEIARLARSGERPDFHLATLLATYFFNFNCASEFVGGVHNPFVERRVRKAFALALDRDAIVEDVLRRGDRPATSFVPPDSMPGYQPPAGLSMNVDEARSLLASAGYPDGVGLPPIELLYTPRDELICQAAARMWEKNLGAVVILRAKESKTFGEDKANQRFMIARGNWYADYNDPTTFLDCLARGNGNNDSGYANPVYDALLDRAARAETPERRFALLQDAERIAVEEDLPILPILHYTAPIAIKPYVKGLLPNPRLLFFFRNVTIDTGRGRPVHHAGRGRPVHLGAGRVDHR